jgi:hypothetical protein
MITQIFFKDHCRIDRRAGPLATGVYGQTTTPMPACFPGPVRNTGHENPKRILKVKIAAARSALAQKAGLPIFDVSFARKRTLIAA